MSRIAPFLVLACSALFMTACASQSASLSDQLTDSQVSECAALRAQQPDLNKTAVLPQYCKDQESLHWSSEKKDPMKLELGKDKKGD